MPTQYFSATAESAQNVTQGLAQQFESKGYTVVGADRAQSAAQSAGLGPSTHYADRVAVQFGRAAGADLVVYPRLLAVGVPMANAGGGNAGGGTGLLAPAAVILLRVNNVHTGANIYCRQIGHEFRGEVMAAPGATTVTLPPPVATATASEVTDLYFQRVQNSPMETSRASRNTGGGGGMGGGMGRPRGRRR
jgi:hypothetical protein